MPYLYDQGGLLGMMGQLGRWWLLVRLVGQLGRLGNWDCGGCYDSRTVGMAGAVGMGRGQLKCLIAQLERLGRWGSGGC